VYVFPKSVCGNTQVHLEYTCNNLPKNDRFGSVINPPTSIFHALLVADHDAVGSKLRQASLLALVKSKSQLKLCTAIKKLPFRKDNFQLYANYG
jgi:hypothetical protein